MPQIGWFEILIVATIAILIIGPKDFPIMLKSIGSWISSLKKYFNEIQKDIVSLENPLDEKNEIEDKYKKKIELTKKDE